MSLGFFFDASSLSHSLSNISERLSAESAEEMWYMSDNSRRCLYPFHKIGPVQLKKSLEMTLAFSRGDLCMVSGDAEVLAGAAGLELLMHNAPLFGLPASRPFFSDLL